MDGTDKGTPYDPSMKTRRWKLRAPTPAEWAGAGLALLGLGAIAVAATTDRYDGWATNVATESLFVAFALVGVEKILRHEQRRRLAPRTERVLWFVGSNLQGIVGTFAIDYAATHTTTYSPLPSRLEAALEHFLAGLDDADEPPRVIDGKDVLLIEARLLEAELAAHRRSDLDVLDPDVVVAIDAFGQSVRLANVRVLVAETAVPMIGEPSEPAAEAARRAAELDAARRDAYRAIGEGVRRLLIAYRRQAGRNRFADVAGAYLSAARMIRERRLAELGATR